MPTAASHRFVLKGWHVWTMLGVFFAVIIGVNGLFVALAMQSFPGEDVKRSYVQGLHYNDTLKARERQATLGWSASAALTITEEGPTLTVQMKDKTGAPLQGAVVSAALRRATTDKDDRALSLVEAAPGLYRAIVKDLPEGGWVLKGNSARDGENFEFTGRMSW